MKDLIEKTFDGDFGNLLKFKDLGEGLFECIWEKVSWSIVLDENFRDNFSDSAIKKGYYKRSEDEDSGFVIFEKKKHLLCMGYESSKVAKAMKRSKKNIHKELQIDFQQYLLDLGEDIPHFFKKPFMFNVIESKKISHWIKKTFDIDVKDTDYLVVKPMNDFRVNIYLKHEKSFMDKFFPDVKKSIYLSDISYKSDFFIMKEIVDIK